MFFVLATLSPTALFAQSTSTADLGLSITPLLPTTVAPGSSGILQFTATNAGPDDIQVQPFASSNILESRPGDFIEFDVSFALVDPAGGCQFSTTPLDPLPFQRPTFVLHFRFPAIAAQSTATCDVRYSVHPLTEPQQIPITWTVQLSAGDDPNPVNDVVNLIFNIAGPAPPSVPVPAVSSMALLQLLGALIAGASVVRRRTRPTR